MLDETERQLQTAAQMPADLMLLKMENETIMAAARIQPRSQAGIITELTALIDSYPEAADEAIYVKPVGTELQVTCKNCAKSYPIPYMPKDGCQCPHCDSSEVKSTKKVKKFAEGLSIRAAESIRSIFGYNRLAVTTEELPDGKVRLSGVFVDYATGSMTADTRLVSPFYTDRFKKQAKHPEDRFLNVLVKAEKSKLRRDLILDSVPNTIKAAFRDVCEKKLAALVTPEKIRTEILPWFLSKGLTLEHLEAIIGRPAALGWTEEDRSKLRQIASALKNEETTVAELLADLKDEGEPQKDAKPAAKKGAVSGADLAKPAKKNDAAAQPPEWNIDRYRDGIGKCDTPEQVNEVLTEAMSSGLDDAQQKFASKIAGERIEKLKSEEGKQRQKELV